MNGMVKILSFIAKMGLYCVWTLFVPGFSGPITKFGFPIRIGYNPRAALVTGMFIAWQKHIFCEQKPTSGKESGKRRPMISILFASVPMPNIGTVPMIFNNSKSVRYWMNVIVNCILKNQGKWN